MTDTYGALCAEGERILLSAGIAEASLEAKLIAEHVCKTDRTAFYAHPERVVGEDQAARMRALFTERAGTRAPLAYLLGEADFMGLTFTVDSSVLIPGQDTEILVEAAKARLHDGMRFLDLCTGSGCVALSLLAYSNDTRGVATDLSKDALRVAGENAKRLSVADRVSLVHCDLFPEKEKPFDLIVSNPPYIVTGEIDSLQPEVARYEPRMALDGGEDGLDFYRRITLKAPEYLIRGGCLLVETGFDQTEAVAALFEKAGFRHIRVKKDYGGNPRVVEGCFYV